MYAARGVQPARAVLRSKMEALQADKRTGLNS